MARNNRSGFTLIEMLVVIGIIAALSGALLMGMGRVQKTAQRAKAQETVANVATALGIIFQSEMNWPTLLSLHSGKQLDASISKVFVYHKLLGVSYDSKSWDADSRTGTINLTGTDRFGIVDPWAADVLKRNKNAALETPVPTGGKIQDHLIWFAVDTDGDGITEANVGGTSVRVRAPAIAWSAGADGRLGVYGQRSKVGLDDVFSWARGQESDK